MAWWDFLTDIGDFASDAADVYEKASPLIDTATDLGGYFLQDKAIADTQAAQQAAVDKSAALSERIYNQNRADIEPFRQSSLQANNRLSQLMGLGGIDEAAIRESIRSKYADILTSPQPPQSPSSFSVGEQNAPTATATTAQAGEWTPYNETADLDYIRRLTGDPEATHLTNWDPVANNYMDANLVKAYGLAKAGDPEAVRYIQNYETNIRPNYMLEAGSEASQKAYRRAEDELVTARQGGGEFLKAGKDYITGQNANYINPFGAGNYNRRDAIEAMLRGDKNEVARQSYAAHYDPTPSFVDKFAPAIAAGIFAAPLAAGAAGFGATAASNTAAGLAGVQPTVAAAGSIKSSALLNAARAGIDRVAV